VGADGVWKKNAGKMLARFFSDGKLPENDKLKKREWYTLLALFILDGVFYDDSQQWKLIARKSKDYLRDAGVDLDYELDELSNMDLEFKE